MGAAAGLSIPDLVMANEISQRPVADVEAYLDSIVAVMMACIDRGMVTEGELPGGLHVKRRAPRLRRRLDSAAGSNNRASPMPQTVIVLVGGICVLGAAIVLSIVLDAIAS